jgi:hypothetical protein
MEQEHGIQVTILHLALQGYTSPSGRQDAECPGCSLCARSIGAKEHDALHQHGTAAVEHDGCKGMHVAVQLTSCHVLVGKAPNPVWVALLPNGFRHIHSVLLRALLLLSTVLLDPFLAAIMYVIWIELMN